MGIWPEACGAARARQGGSSLESSDEWMTTLFFFKDFYFAKAADLMEQKKCAQYLWVFCSLLVLGSEGENAALQRGLQAVLQAGFLTLCLMMALENWRYTSPRMLTHSTLGSLERSWVCCTLLVRCVVISGDYAYSACNSGILNRTAVVSQWAPRWGYSPIPLLHLSFWLCWRCTISCIFLQGGTQLRPCCYPAALRSWLWAFHVHGEIIFSCSFFSSDFLPGHYV